jgi:hypothetical protein
MHKRPIGPGTILEVADGQILGVQRFAPDATASWLLNPQTSPEECVAALARLESRIAWAGPARG